MNEMINQFTNYMYQESYSKNTIDTYNSNLKLFFDWKNKYDNLYTINRDNILNYKQYLQECKYNAKSINNKLSSVKKYNEFLIDKNYQDNFVIIKKDMIKINEDKISPTNLTKADVDTFFNNILHEKSYAAYRDYTIVSLLGYTGVRISECLNIELDDLDLDKDEILIRNGKGNKQRTAYIHKNLHSILVKYLKESRYDVNKYHSHINSNYLFISKQSDKINRATINQVFIDHRKDDGMHPHALRHYFCTRALEGSFDIHEVAYLAGHSSINTTARYTNPTKKTMKEKMNRL